MASLLSLFAIFGLVAAIPLLIVWSVIKLTNRSHSARGKPQLFVFTSSKVGLFVLISYTVLFLVLWFLSVGGHMAHADFYGARSVPTSRSLAIVDWLFAATGYPTVPLAELLAAKTSLRLSAFDILLLHFANGIVLSFLAILSLSYLKRESKPNGKTAA